MLDTKKVDQLEAYRKRTHDWAKAYGMLYLRYTEEINSRRWFAKLWNRGSFCIIFLSIFIGTLVPQIIHNTVLMHYVQYVLVVISAVLWIRFVWSLLDGPEGPLVFTDADMVEQVDTGDLKSSAIRRVGSNPTIGTNSP